MLLIKILFTILSVVAIGGLVVYLYNVEEVKLTRGLRIKKTKKGGKNARKNIEL